MMSSSTIEPAGAHDCPASRFAVALDDLRPLLQKLLAQNSMASRSAFLSTTITKRFSPMKPSIAFLPELGGFDLDELGEYLRPGVRKPRTQLRDTSNFWGTAARRTRGVQWPPKTLRASRALFNLQ